MNRIDAGIDEPLADLYRFLKGVPRLLQLEQRVVVIDGADLHLQMEVGADLGPDRLDDLDHEAGAILEGAAVFVLAIVDGGAEVLRDQVPVGAVQLDAVETRLARAPRALGECRHGLLDVGCRHALALEAVQRIFAIGRTERVLVFDATDVTLTARVTELHDEAAVELVHRLAHRPPERDALVFVDGGVVGNDPAANLHRDEGRNDGADATLRELRFPVDPRLIAGTVVVIEAARDVGTEDSILDREGSELQWFEDDVGHTNLARLLRRPRKN